MRYAPTLACIAAIALSGCDLVDEMVENAAAERVSQLEQELRDLESKVLVNEYLISANKVRIDHLRTPSARLSADSKGYAIAHTDYGTLILTPGEVTPHLDGFRFKVSVGNLSAATLRGTTASVEWGPEYSTDVSWEEYRASRLQKEIVFTEDFRPGRYTDIELVLTPAGPADLKEIDIEFEFDQISLPR